MRLIDVETLKQKLTAMCTVYNDPYELYDNCLQDVVSQIDDLLDSLPTVDPVKRGYWINEYGDAPYDSRDRNYWWKCSECGHSVSTSFKSNYCPNCGARMECDTNEPQ